MLQLFLSRLEVKIFDVDLTSLLLGDIVLGGVLILVFLCLEFLILLNFNLHCLLDEAFRSILQVDRVHVVDLVVGESLQGCLRAGFRSVLCE